MGKYYQIAFRPANVFFPFAGSARSRVSFLSVVFASSYLLPHRYSVEVLCGGKVLTSSDNSNYKKSFFHIYNQFMSMKRSKLNK